RVSKNDIKSYLDERTSGGDEQPAEAVEEEPAKAETPEKKASAGGQQRSISAGELDIQRPTQKIETIKMGRMRKTIAEHMIRSKKTSAHVTTLTEVDVTRLVGWREKNKAEFKVRAGVKLTYTPLFIEQIIQAIREFPLLN